MLSAHEKAMVQVAVEMCNSRELKRKILWDPETHYKRTLEEAVTSPEEFCISVVEETANTTLKNEILPPFFIRKLVPLAYEIGRNMQIWDEYHGRILDLPPGYSFEFLNRSFFTERGLIDNRKTAQALIAAGNLSIKQKYKLACLHCFQGRIFYFYDKMTEKDKEEFYDAENPTKIMQPGLVKFWTYFLMNDVDKLRGDQSYHDFRLETIVKSGNISAFEYWLKGGYSELEDELVNAALKTLAERIKVPKTAERLLYRFGMVSMNDTQDYMLRYAAPREYYVDVVLFLLFKMKEDERIRFLRNDIERFEKGGRNFGAGHSRVLRYCLKWPYQYLFMKTAKEMWNFLPEDNFAFLLLKIVDKFDTIVPECLEYCDEMVYDYRSLLTEFWEQSLDHYKRYIFSDHYVAYGRRNVKTCSGLLEKLFRLKYVARTHIAMILASAAREEYRYIFSSVEWLHICIYLMKFKWAELEDFVINDILENRGYNQFKRDFTTATSAQAACVELMKRDEWGKAESFIKWSVSPEEELKLRENIVSTEEWKRACLELMYKEEWNKLDEFILRYFQSKEKVYNFKRKFSSREDVQTFCTSTFIRSLKWDAAESFLEWTALNEEELKALKRKMIKSPDGRITCCCFFREFSGVEAIEKFIRWHCPPGEVKELKRDLIFSDEGFSACSEFAENDKLELASEFINFCLSSEEDMKEIKKQVAYKKGNEVAKLSLLFYDAYVYFLDTKSDTVNWERIERFLAWCFSSQEEISEFKRTALLVESGKEIHFRLIQRKQWDVAEKFFAWLGLSPEEESELKKNTLFHHLEAQEMFYELLSSEEGHEKFATYGSKEKAIELYSRWYLTDKEAAIEFRNKFGIWKYTPLCGKKKEIVRESLAFVVTQRMKDFELSEHERKES